MTAFTIRAIGLSRDGKQGVTGTQKPEKSDGERMRAGEDGVAHERRLCLEHAGVDLV